MKGERKRERKQKMKEKKKEDIAAWNKFQNAK